MLKPFNGHTMPLQPPQFRFGEFLLDTAAFDLRRNGRRVRIERRALDLLILLLERRGELVSRPDIVARLWGKDVFIDVESGINTAIRKVRQALHDDAEAPTCIETVPGKGYRFIAPVETAATDSPPASVPEPVTDGAPGLRHDAGTPTAVTRDTPAWWRTAAASAVVAVAALAGLAVWRPGTAEVVPDTPMRVVPMTTLSGLERDASFSPDGRQVTFTWSGEDRKNWDVYVMLAGTSEQRRLTSGPERDTSARWSPDGRAIAYVRVEADDRQHLRVMSALGGADRQVTGLDVVTNATWSPDGRYLLTGVVSGPGGAGLFLVPVDGGEPRRVTTPAGLAVDWTPEFSPDGRRVAYASCADSSSRSNCHLMVLEVGPDTTPTGSPKQLTRASFWSALGITWSRDGQTIVYGVAQPGSQSLWQVDVNGTAPPQVVELAGAGAGYPRVVPSTGGLAFTRFVGDTDVYRIAGSAVPEAIARSSVFDGSPVFSPDGRAVAFCSTRAGGVMQVWVAGADGSDARPVTHGPGRLQCAPTWAPDGLSIAFESLGPTGAWSIWSISLEGGAPREIAPSHGDRRSPRWSRDGRWMFFSSDHGGTRNIWRVGNAGAPPEQLTHEGSGLRAMDTLDGTMLLYQKGSNQPREPGNGPLFLRQIGGDHTRQLLPCVRGSAFTAARGGVYYVPCGAEQASVHVLDLDSGRSRRVASLPGYQNNVPPGLAVAPDELTILYDRRISDSDLMLIENFR